MFNNVFSTSRLHRLSREVLIFTRCFLKILLSHFYFLIVYHKRLPSVTIPFSMYAACLWEILLRLILIIMVLNLSYHKVVVHSSHISNSFFVLRNWFRFSFLDLELPINTHVLSMPNHYVISMANHLWNFINLLFSMIKVYLIHIFINRTFFRSFTVHLAFFIYLNIILLLITDQMVIFYLYFLLLDLK